MQLLGDLPEATMSGKKTKRKQKEASASCCLSSACKNRTKGKEQESFSLRDPDLKRDQHHLPFHFWLLGLREPVTILGTDMEYNHILCYTGYLAINISVCHLFLLRGNRAENGKHPVQHPCLTSLFKKRLEFLTFSFICEVNNFFYFNRIFQENVFFSLFPLIMSLHSLYNLLFYFPGYSFIKYTNNKNRTVTFSLRFLFKYDSS